MIRILINPTRNIFQKATRQLLIGTTIIQQQYSNADNNAKQSLIPSKSQKTISQLNLGSKVSQSEISAQEVSQHEQLGGKGTRIQIAIFKIQLSQFIDNYSNKIPIFKQIQQYNPALTHGGLQFEQFPLVKLIHIALHLIRQNKIEVAVWKKLQFFIRKRMHRCTVEQNMRVLLIMLKAFPHYRFDYDFILSTCLALKKELLIMNNEELQKLFFVLFTNQSSPIRYQNAILIDLQTLILGRVIKKAEAKMEQTNKGEKSHLPIQFLVQWINLGLTFSIRNKYDPLSLENKALRLMTEFNSRWECIVKNNQGVKSLPEETVHIIMDLLGIYHKIVQYQSKNQAKMNRRDRKDKTEEVNYCSEFKNTEWSMFIHSRKTINRLIKQQPTQATLHLFCCLTQIYSLQQIDNILDADQTNPQFKQHSQLPVDKQYQQLKFHANRLLRVEDSSEAVVRDKLKIISKFLDLGVYAPQIAKTYYQSLQLPNTGTLETVQCLIKIELLLFSNQTQFSPRTETASLVMNFLENHNQTYRHFDWQSFHFTNLIAQHTKMDQISANLPAHGNHYQNKLFTRAHSLSNKILQQIKLSNTSGLVEEEMQVLGLKKEVKELEKFFIEIRVHAMEKGKSVISPFCRLPHFANVKDRIAVNAYSAQQLRHRSVILEKRLFNLMGWKVVNIDAAQFMQLLLNDRLKLMSSCVEGEARIVEQHKSRYLANGLSLPSQS